MPEAIPTRDELASLYLEQLVHEPYPVQEEALLAWFTGDEGVMVCAPTGMGKTLIAEAALFEALHHRKIAYYTTPLIALTDQKFQEMQAAAVRWGFRADDVGLVTGNRSINPQAQVLVVVAEILLNRLLHPAAFDFSHVGSVVMDEFHNFADRERGIVWEIALGLLPQHVRLLLLSATVGNSGEFIGWLRRNHHRSVQLIQSTERRVPLSYQWVGDQLLNEQLEDMASGDEPSRRTPALVFCFNREECWSVAEQLKGKALLAGGQQKLLAAEAEKYDWSQGAGPKLKQILLRGVGVHHAGLLPKYRRIVEEFFQKKLLSVAVCTETLAAGINLPARSVVLTSLMKGPPGEKTLIDASSAHQMFGRAGRPQFDDRGFVYAIAHEDDVKIARWQEKYDQIPENTKDPGLLAAKKKIKKKMPTRRKNEQYWNQAQFEKLIIAPPGKLYSKGSLPWRLLAYLLQISPEVERLRVVVGKRLMDAKRIEAGQRALDRMLMTLWAGGFVTLEPEPPKPADAASTDGSAASPTTPDASSNQPAKKLGLLGTILQAAQAEASQRESGSSARHEPESSSYRPLLAHPKPTLETLLVFRSVNPIYGAFLLGQLGPADRAERIQAFESVLDVPGSMAKLIRVPRFEDLPPGTLALGRLDNELLQRGLVSAEDLKPKTGFNLTWEERWVPTLAEKLRLLFDSEFPDVKDLRTTPVWSAGELLALGGDFNKYVTAKTLTKQEGMIFRHLLRLILLCGEFLQVSPPDTSADEWRADLTDVIERLTKSCRTVDPDSTDKAIEAAQATPDVVTGETALTTVVGLPST
ncbi:MAG: DEAD/DEAH box helicase [Planctomycetaceae bacterium]